MEEEELRVVAVAAAAVARRSLANNLALEIKTIHIDHSGSPVPDNNIQKPAVQPHSAYGIKMASLSSDPHKGDCTLETHLLSDTQSSPDTRIPTVLHLTQGTPRQDGIEACPQHLRQTSSPLGKHNQSTRKDPIVLLWWDSLLATLQSSIEVLNFQSDKLDTQIDIMNLMAEQG
ncbi:hypothetical protein NDU88_006221 [Pleurodeles waltl]|uniref:Uncharacterized protein n=1 Tax=Pleurodeles waltl TaxID=8319 RepID=A0AAV7MF59_PLEWA|nr:hypothetical protein NDU88_006221 [Pleurodeles waltl]